VFTTMSLSEEHVGGDDGVVLVTGATGYVGGRLVPRLLAAGYRVRCLVRDPARLEGRSWLPEVEVVRADVLQPESLEVAVRGVGTAFYLVHSLAEGAAFHDQDLRAARHFAAALRDAGGRRVIYLGGLGDSAAALSPHLRSRQATGDALREAGLPVTELRAAVVVGSGSLSFEMIRYLTERVPVMICPSWVYTRVQPIAIENVLDCLVAALGRPAPESEVIEVGGVRPLPRPRADLQRDDPRGRSGRRGSSRARRLTRTDEGGAPRPAPPAPVAVTTWAAPRARSSSDATLRAVLAPSREFGRRRHVAR